MVTTAPMIACWYSLNWVSKLLMVQPFTGSNNPSPSSAPPTTPIVKEIESDTNPTTPSYDNPPKPSNGQFDSKNF